MKHAEKENKLERMMREFSEDMFKTMEWGKMPVSRFKAGNTNNWRGYCFSTGLEIFIVVSTNDTVHRTDKDFWNSLVHELIHTYLCYTGVPMLKAFGHGKVFKNVAKQIATKTNNQFTYKGIMR